MSDSNIKKSKQLGMPIGTATNRLKKQILFNLIKKANENFCFQCGAEIENVNELSIEHKIPWLDSEKPLDLFFNLDNIAFSHLSCNAGAARVVNQIYRKSRSKFKGVLYPTHRHKKYRVKIKGKFYGSYDCPIEAAKEHDKIVINLFGNEGMTNKRLGLLNEGVV